MRILVLAGLATATAASSAPPAGAPGGPPPSSFISPLACENPLRVIPAESDIKPEQKKLGELPPGDLILSVYRTENGCPAPVIVRQGIGAVDGDGARAAPPEPLRPRARLWR